MMAVPDALSAPVTLRLELKVEEPVVIDPPCEYVSPPMNTEEDALKAPVT
jgi:hypothetical protein